MKKSRSFSEHPLGRNLNGSTNSLVGLRELEQVKAINNALLNDTDDESLSNFNQEDIIDNPDDDFFDFYDYDTEEVLEVPIKPVEASKRGEEEEDLQLAKNRIDVNTGSSMKHSVSEGNLQRRSSLKKNLSYGSLNSLSVASSEPKIKTNVSFSGPSMKRSSSAGNFQRRSSFKKDLSFGSSNTLSELSSEPKMKRNVSFTSLDVREYEVTLGDNPAVRRGPPISLSWTYNEADSIDIEHFEASRAPRRTKCEMIINSQVRKCILREKAGISQKEIREVTAEIKQIKKNRNKTISRNSFSRVEEALESAVRKVKRAMPGSTTTKSL